MAPSTSEPETPNTPEILKARRLDDILDEASYDPAFDRSICARVVHIMDDAGNASHQDTPLDNTYAE